MNSSAPQLASFLERLQIPNLRDFEFYFASGYTNRTENSVEHLQIGLNEIFTQNAGNLLSLKLQPCQETTSGQILELLKLISHLRRFTIRSRNYFGRWRRSMAKIATLVQSINDTLIEGLTPSPEARNSEIPCSRLESFDAFEDLQTGITRETLQRLINARRNSEYWNGSPLERVNVSLAYSDPDRKQYESWLDGIAGRTFYLRKPARETFSPWEGIPFSNEEIAMESPLDRFNAHLNNKMY